MKNLVPSNRRWWQPDVLSSGSDARANALASDVQLVRDRQQYQEMLQQLHCMLFGDVPTLGFTPHSYARTSADFTDRLSLNIVQNLCRAANARITKNKPKPTYITDDGDWEQEKKAEDIQRIQDGLRYENKLYELYPLAHLHATVWGSGHVKHFVDWEGGPKGEPKICTEIAFPFNLVIDDAEAQYPGRLRTMAERRYVDRYEFAHFAEQIEKTKGLPPEYTDSRSLKDRVMECSQGPSEARDLGMKATADLVCVYEAWHLPSGFESGDGRHVISTHEFCVVDEEWERRRFPFSKVDWCQPLQGYSGVGIAQLLTGLQIEVNEILTQISRGYHLIRGMWVVNKGSGVNVNHLNNDLDRIVQYAGDASMRPEYVTPPSIITPEIYNQLQQYYAWAHDIVGISESTSQGEKPEGVQSGKAIRTIGNIQSERLIPQMRSYENLFLDTDEYYIELLQEIGTKKPGFQLKALGRSGFSMVNFVDSLPDDYVMKVFPTSALADEPGQKLQDVAELMQLQDSDGKPMIDGDVAMEMLQLPDTREFESLRNSWRHAVQNDIMRIVRHGQYHAPEPEYRVGMPGELNPSLQICTAAIVKYYDKNVPRERMDMLRNYMEQLRELQRKAGEQAPAPAQPEAPPGAPPAPGGPPGPGAPPPTEQPMPPGAPIQ